MHSIYGIPVKVFCPVRSDLNDASVATEFYRIAQEAVHNAAKHANATEIRVHLLLTQHSTRLTVTDDGHGIVDEGDEGMGLRIMKYRADLIGATFQVRSNEPSGTTITCELSEPPSA